MSDPSINQISSRVPTEELPEKIQDLFSHVGPTNWGIEALKHVVMELSRRIVKLNKENSELRRKVDNLSIDYDRLEARIKILEGE